MSRFLSAVLAVACLFSIVAYATPSMVGFTSVEFSSCLRKPMIVVTALMINPYPVVTGTSPQILVEASLKAPISVNDTFTVKITELGVQLYTKTGKLVSLLNGSATTEQKVNLQIVADQIPSMAPAGTYEVQFTAQSEAYGQTLCIKFPLKITRAAVVAQEKSSQVAATTAGTALNFTSCATGSYLTVTEVTSSPYPVIIGGSFSLTITGTLTKQLTSGNYTLKVQYKTFTVETKTGDICSFGGLSCPKAAGDLVLSNSNTIPGYAPKGVYTFVVSGVDSAGASIFCISANLDMTKSSSTKVLADW